jgi:hypothetical protein
VIPVLDLNPADSHELQLQLLCSQDLESIHQDLVKILRSIRGFEILKSDELQRQPHRWRLLLRVCEENGGLFNLQPISSEGDERLLSNIDLDVTDDTSIQLLLGGASFPEFAEHLQKHEAVAGPVRGDYFRRGEKLPTYVHVARLWGDQAFQFKVIHWLRGSLHWLGLSQFGIEPNGKGLIILAYLHPAIELAQYLMGFAPFAAAELVEMRRASDLRWDFGPLLNVDGAKVLILIDMVLNGTTIRNIVTAVQYLGLDTIACFSLLSVDGVDLGVKHCTFCKCTKQNLVELSRCTHK